ncbi:hypothetical protein [Nostoc sp. ChiVER01]|uniref:hypothetical protein n=1 Tax=Nostoc sp. ChiVER01 TaxID=3075382 RepID=UPI002AD26F3D|nr:hypothetical protein [Nostoc sp. ChiVER01]MDZ8223752.1 hypothetical protein [Nostoc sp. ChiVER01]
MDGDSDPTQYCLRRLDGKVLDRKFTLITGFSVGSSIPFCLLSDARGLANAALSALLDKQVRSELARSSKGDAKGNSAA